MQYRPAVHLSRDDWEPLWYLTPAGEAVKVYGTTAISRVDSSHPYTTYTWCRVSQRTAPSHATWLVPGKRVFLADKRLHTRHPSEKAFR